MPKSGYLPDISGVFMYWRTVYRDGLKTGNWSDVSLGLNNMNGSLDEEYRLEVSNSQWEEMAESYIVWSCPHCTVEEEKIVNKGKDNEYVKTIQVPTESKREDIRIYTEHCDQETQYITGERTRDMWICPACNQSSSVAGVKATQISFPFPHYRNCIYKEPQMPLTGLKRRRGTYPQEMREWAKYYSQELEHKLALYRLEYIKQHEGEDMAFNWEDKGDG